MDIERPASGKDIDQHEDQKDGGKPLLELIQEKKLNLLILAVMLVAAIIGMLFILGGEEEDQAASDMSSISSFQECVDAGHPVLESFPEQCSVPNGQTFVDEVTQGGDDDVLSGDTLEYRNDEFGISFSYPSEWGEAQGSVTDYTDSDVGTGKALSISFANERDTGISIGSATRDWAVGKGPFPRALALWSGLNTDDTSGFEYIEEIDAYYDEEGAIEGLWGVQYVFVTNTELGGFRLFSEDETTVPVMRKIMESFVEVPVVAPIAEPDEAVDEAGEEVVLGEGQVLVNGEAVGLPVQTVDESCKASGGVTFCSLFDGELRTSAAAVNNNTDWSQFGVTIDEITRDVTLNGEPTEDYFAFIVTVNFINAALGSDTLFNAEFSILNSERVWSAAVTTEGLEAKNGEFGVMSDSFPLTGTVKQVAIFFDATDTTSGSFKYSPGGNVWGDLVADFTEQ